MCHEQKVLVEMAPVLEVLEGRLLYLGLPGDVSEELRVLRGRIQGPVGLGAEILHWERQTDAVEEPGLLEGAVLGPGHRK
jgi:hypothetical protein